MQRHAEDPRDVPAKSYALNPQIAASSFFFLNTPPPPEIPPLPPPAALPISPCHSNQPSQCAPRPIPKPSTNSLAAPSRALPTGSIPSSTFKCTKCLNTSRNALIPTLKNAKDRKSTRLNSSHGYISYAVFCLK